MMCIQIIHDNIDAPDFWIDHIHQIAHRKSKILFGTTISYQDITKASLWLNEHEQITRAISFVLIILSIGMPRAEGQ